MAVDEARQHGCPAGVEPPVGRRGLPGVADPGDPAVVDDQRGVVPQAERPVAVRRVGHQLADVVDEQARSVPAAHRVTAEIAAPSSAATSTVACTPAVTTGRPSTSTSVTSAAPAAKSDPGRRHPGGADPVQARPSPGRRAARWRCRPASDQPSASCPARLAALSSSAAVKVPAEPGCAAARPAPAPRASSNRSMTAWLSLPRLSGLPASASCGAGPIPSARSRSVVGQKQTPVRLVAEQPYVGVAEVGGVHCRGARPEHAGVGEQLGRGAAVRRLAGLVLGGLLRQVQVQRRVPLPCPRRDHRQLRGRHRPHRVHRRADADVAAGRGEGVHPLCPAVGVAVAESSLRPGERGAVDPGAQVAGVQQGDPDAGLRGGGHQRRHSSRSGRRSGRRRGRGAGSGTRRRR